MRAEEIKNGRKCGGIVEPFAQCVWGEPGERQQPFRSVLVAQHPAERRQRQRLGIRGG